MTAFLYETKGSSNCSHFLHIHSGDTAWGLQSSINSQLGHPTDPLQIIHLRSTFFSAHFSCLTPMPLDQNPILVFLNRQITDNTFAIIFEWHFYPAHFIKATSFCTISSNDSSNSKSIFLFLIQYSKYGK